MRKMISALAVVVLLSGCSLTNTEKALITGAGLLAIGIIATQAGGSDKCDTPGECAGGSFDF